jgi:hypothetical protein
LAWRARPSMGECGDDREEREERREEDEAGELGEEFWPVPGRTLPAREVAKERRVERSKEDEQER